VAIKSLFSSNDDCLWALFSICSYWSRIFLPLKRTSDFKTESAAFNCFTQSNTGARKYRLIENDCRGTIVQRKFRTKLGKQPPSDNSIRRRYTQFQETGCVCIPELKVRIRTAVQTITTDMLQTVWNELDYRVDVCRITKGAHIEHLYGM